MKRNFKIPFSHQISSCSPQQNSSTVFLNCISKLYAFNLWKEISKCNFARNIRFYFSSVILNSISQSYFSAENLNCMLLTCEEMSILHQISSQTEAWENVKWDLHFIPEYKSIDFSSLFQTYNELILFQTDLGCAFSRQNLISHIPPKSESWIILLWSN